MPNNSMLRNGLSGARMGAGVLSALRNMVRRGSNQAGAKIATTTPKMVNQGIKNIRGRNARIAQEMQ